MKELVKLYEDGLKEFLGRRGEQGWGRAHEIGGVALREGKTANEMAGAFQMAMAALLESLPPFAERIHWLQDSASFFAESLKPLEISTKSLRMMIGDLQRRAEALERSNETLQAEISEHRKSAVFLHRQAALLDNASDAIVVCSLDGRVVYVNRSAALSYGFGPEEAAGRPYHDILRQEEPSSKLQEAFRKVREKGRWRGEFKHKVSQGEGSTSSRWTLVPGKDNLPSRILIMNCVEDQESWPAPGSSRRRRVAAVNGGMAAGPKDSSGSLSGKAPPTSPSGRGELVLVVDDDGPIREIARITLEKNGYRVITAGDGAEAVSVFARYAGQIKAVLIDITMPYMSGDKAIRSILQIDPDIRIIASSGYAASASISEIAELKKVLFLRKPYRSEALLEMLRRAVEETGKGSGENVQTKSLERGPS